MTETIQKGVVAWTSETAHVYQCPVCLSPVFTHYEGDVSPERVECLGLPWSGSHVVTWPDAPVEQAVTP